MNNRILIFGDSITWGANDSEGGWATRLKVYTDEQTVAGKEDYDTVYPLGVSGNKTDDLLVRFEAEIKSRLDDESNIVVLIAIGVNDSQFQLKTEENRVPIRRFQANLAKLLTIAQA